MPTADDITAQLKQAEELKRQAEKHRAEEKDLLRKQITEMDKQISDMRQKRDKAAADLSKLG